MLRTPNALSRSTGRVSLLLAIGVVAMSALFSGAAPTAAVAADSDLLTTASTRTVAWTDGQRHPDDLADPAVFDRLKDWRLRVSQTSDLLNQTVEVSWTSKANSGFLQLMQCWSDGPDVPPTREQCAYGGADAETASSTGAGRTRALSRDARERTYRNDGQLVLLSVGDGPAAPNWASEQSVVYGTTSGSCPAAATSHDVSIVPPRDALVSGASTGTATITTRTPGVPAPLVRLEGGFSRTYPAVTQGFRLADVPATAGPGQLALGQYRLQLACRADDGTELARFVGYAERYESEGARRWRQPFRPGGVSVPFDPLGSTAETAPTDPYLPDEVLEYLKPRSTNEVTAAKVRPDGGGQVFMELQTDLEAQHLGCGRVETSGPRSCWLVAVPRWTPEPDGRAVVPDGQYSPMSQTLWDRRIQVPLAFAPVATGCRIGTGLKQLLSNDSAIAALRSWQPTFCGSDSTASSVLGPLQDFTVRSGVSQPNRMGVVTVPDLDEPTVVKAPLATSGIVVGFAADRQIPFSDDATAFALNETRNTVMNLNARLVAKLLTQSYDTGAAPNGGKTSGFNASEFSGFTPTFSPQRQFPAENPRRLYDDPEFLRLNPAFAEWLSVGRDLVSPAQMGDVLVSANETDAYRVLWQWIAGDPEARSFLDGAPDPDGMRINPYYRGQITEDTASFPLLDPTCVDNIQDPAADEFPELCQINNHPRVEDDSRAAQAAIRGDTRRVNVPPTVLTGAVGELTYRPEPRQEPGKAGMLVITTSAYAARFGLPTARLRNSSGAFVEATAASLAAAREQATVREDGVLVANPSAVRDAGYPLTTTSYAIVDVASTTQAQNDAFASILEYGAGPGQLPGNSVGQLPPGYGPLTPALSAQTRRAAALLRAPQSLLPTPAPTASPSPSATTPAATSAPTVAPVAPVATPLAPAPAPSPTPTSTPTRAPSPTPTPAPRPSDTGAPVAPEVDAFTPEQSSPVDLTSVAGPLTAGGMPEDGSSVALPEPAPQVAPTSPPSAVSRLQAALTTSPVAQLPWAVPGLVLVTVLAATGSRVLRTVATPRPAL